jgi:hypothetical protein
MSINDIIRTSPSLHPKFRELSVPTLALFGSLTLYVAARSLLRAMAHSAPLDCLWLDLLSAATALFLAFIRYDEVPPALRLLARGIGAVVLIQVAFDGSTLFYAPASMLVGAAGGFFRVGTAIALITGVAAMVRPAFLLPLMIHYVLFRHQLNLLTSVDISETDYLSMLDVGAFCAIGTLITALAGRDFGEAAKRAGAGLVWAWTKLRAGGDDPLFWLFHNPTQTSILIGLERGDNPLGAWPWLVQREWNGITGSVILLNAFVLGSQLAAPLAALHRRSLMALTLLYDLFHIGVYFTLGALFIFWIAVNLLIFQSARHLGRKDGFTRPMKATLFVSVFASHYLFYTSHLGWLDGAKLTSPSVEAETVDGRRIAVPSVFFGIRSYSIAQTLMYAPEGHFPVRIGGNSYNPTDWRDAQACGPVTADQQDTGTSYPAVENMIRETDAAMRAAPLVKNDNLYYLYPHHMLANPLIFRNFNGLSMKDIVAYHYVVESVCLGLKDGHLTRDVRKTTDYPVDVRR